MKECKKCGKTKDFSAFKKDKRNENGAGSPCLDCYKIYILSDKNKELSKNRGQKWRERNREKNRGNPIFLERYKKYHLENKDKISEYNRKYRQKNKDKINLLNKKDPKKSRCRWLVKEAVKHGRIDKPSFCEICKQKKDLEAHHNDYNFPLEVEWLCISCHKQKHLKYKGLTNEQHR